MGNQPENGCLLLTSACLLGIPCKPRGQWHATTMLLDSLGSYPEVLTVESGPTLGAAHVWSLGSSRARGRHTPSSESWLSAAQPADTSLSKSLPMPSSSSSSSSSVPSSTPSSSSLSSSPRRSDADYCPGRRNLGPAVAPSSSLERERVCVYVCVCLRVCTCVRVCCRWVGG